MIAQYGTNVSLEDDLRADGEPEREFHPGIAARMPRKRVAAGALIHDEHERILFVEPIYKPFLDIPGGVVDEHEAPAQACRREVEEELGLQLPIVQLLVVDWLPANGVWGDGINFVFDGGHLDSTSTADLQLMDSELKAIHWLILDEAASRLRPSMHRRLAKAVDALHDGIPRYAEFGR